MIELLFVDESGTIGVIHNDLTIDSLQAVDKEVQAFVRNAGTNDDGEMSSSLETLHPEFTIDLFTNTDVRELEVIGPPTVG